MRRRPVSTVLFRSFWAWTSDESVYWDALCPLLTTTASLDSKDSKDQAPISLRDALGTSAVSLLGSARQMALSQSPTKSSVCNPRRTLTHGLQRAADGPIFFSTSSRRQKTPHKRK
ncbi:uncharacterized protein K460DRAFT_29049 [Cucurbitaria berberidis CBS 394.84]|uniref:Uncharacterized protein n=1 Tax=Cucurbitaria berberidis CBS 394.84 TaxID=1168544 RepID=A0A9P4GR30_9PLEO|nr:uncharacterized protein K460DRAFT_29049 [Cucurbitaria berberidis CBS 394.84]KAF1851163.1 hypothetical protein K460DRAFT_29049 [Cucurbitaria berberidis CBS 394.84]